MGRVRIAAAALIAACAALWSLAAAAQVEGGFFGIDAAQGMRLELSSEGGALRLPDGTRFEFRGEVVGGALEATLERPEGPAFLRVTPRPAGVEAVLAPVDAQGLLDVGATQAFAFLRDGTPLPDLPRGFLPAPAAPVRAFDARAFVRSYAFWEPLGAALAYDALEPRMRTVIRLFPIVHTDLLWKLCQSPESTAGLAEALRGQGVSCAEVNDAMRRALAGASFTRFKADVAAERAILDTAIGCADDLSRTDPDCRRAGQETARRAVSMETAATVLRRYR